jgi:hypothetical protein
MARGRQAREVIVNGVSACMREHGVKYGVKYTTLMHRLLKKWTLEQALGLAPKPKRPNGNIGGRWSKLRDGPQMGTAFDNIWQAMAGELTAEEYLRREGVPANGYVLSSRDH